MSTPYAKAVPVPARFPTKPLLNVGIFEESPFDDPFGARPGRASVSFTTKCNLAALDTISANRQAAEPPRAKTVGNCKEVDSGIPSLETASSAPGDSSASSSPLSVASAPASLGTRDDISLNTSSATLTPPDSPPPRSAFTNDLLSAKDPWSIPRFNDVHLHLLERSFELFQAVRPSEDCLFIGNLPASCTDYQLAIAVKVLFEQYGTCEVMIGRRYSAFHVKPFAYVQFLWHDHALAALAGNGHQVIGRRILRVSPSTAKRSVLFIAHNSQNLHLFPSVLEGIGGPIEEAEWLSSGVMEVKFLHHGSYAAVKRWVRKNGYMQAWFTIHV